MATETKGKKKSWPKIGSVRKGDSGTSYIKLDEGVEVFVKGEKVELNKSRTLTLQDPRKQVQGMRDRGIITEQQADERLEKLSELTFLKYDIVCPPPKAE